MGEVRKVDLLEAKVLVDTVLSCVFPYRPKKSLYQFFDSFSLFSVSSALFLVISKHALEFLYEIFDTFGFLSAVSPL